jgi:hypothetical protein
MFKLLLLVSIAAAAASGQWLHQPTPDIPRTPGGKPDLSAPAPKTGSGRPDLSGVWRLDFGANFFDVATDLQPGDTRPWADNLYRQRLATPSKDRWTVMCLPGGPALGLDRQIEKIVQMPQLILILYEDLTYRQIFLDGREFPSDPNPTWMGYSVGHWDNDTLVVESAGFNDRTWLDYGGHPHTEALRIAERYRRMDAGHISVEITYSDPQAYSKQWTIGGKLSLAADTELIESVCAENEKDRSHLVVDDAKIVSIPVEVLAKYVGTYQFVPPIGPTPSLKVDLLGNQLMMDFGKSPLKPLSETVFSSTIGLVIQFVMDGKGEVTHLVVQTVEGDLRAVRKR